MKEWYGLNDVEYDKLTKRISILDLIKSRHIFYAIDAPVSKVNLLLYLDTQGTDSIQKHYFIFKACLNSLPADEKVEVLKYIDWLENDD